VVGIIVWAVLSGHYAHAVVFYVLYVGMLMLFLLRLRTTDRGIVHYSHQYRLRPSPVVFTVFAPRHIARGHSFILSLWVHFPEQIDTVLKLAQLLQPSEAVGLRAGVPIELGTDIVFSLHLPTLNVDYGLDKVTWTGQPSNASFRVRVPTYTTSDLHDGHIDVYTGGIRIARVLFSVALSSEEPSTSQERLRSRIERLQTAFASYASADLVDVLGRIQGMKKIAPDLDVFLDALSLRSGDLWESRLAEEVISREIFYLFWSRNAAKSTWVGREWQQHWQIEVLAISIQCHWRRQKWPRLPMHLLLFTLAMHSRPLRFCREV